MALGIWAEAAHFACGVRAKIPHFSDRAERLFREQTEAQREQVSALAKRFTTPAFRAAKTALMRDIASRSPFEPWTPQSGYVFYPASDTHARIYNRMLAQVQHPDYFVDQPYGQFSRTYLRRRFPLRHEVAAGAGLGALGYAADAD